MKKSELNEVINQAVVEVLKKNTENVNTAVREAFGAGEEDSQLPLTEVIARSTSLCLTLAPSLSAAVTARILVNLGLVVLEDDE